VSERVGLLKQQLDHLAGSITRMTDKLEPLVDEHDASLKKLQLRVNEVDLDVKDLKDYAGLLRETRRCVHVVDSRAAGAAPPVCRRWCPSCTMAVDDSLEHCFQCLAPWSERFVGRARNAAPPPAAGNSSPPSASAPSTSSATRSRLAKPLAEQFARFDTLSDSGSDTGPLGIDDLAAAASRLGVPYKLSDGDCFD